MTMTLACPFVWDGKCHAWGTSYPISHGCRFDPDHEGEHRCACGAMCPREVCVVCGEPRGMVVEDNPELARTDCACSSACITCGGQGFLQDHNGIRGCTMCASTGNGPFPAHREARGQR